jgi:hypothetical protein
MAVGRQRLSETVFAETNKHDSERTHGLDVSMPSVTFRILSM